MNFDVLSWRSLKTRVAVLTVTVLLCGIWSVSWLASRELRRDMVEQLSQQQFSVVSVLADQVNQNLSDRFKALQLVGAELSGLMGDPVAAQALLEQRPVLQGLFDGGVGVVGPDGTALADVPREIGRVGRDYIGMDAVAIALREGRANVGRPIMSPVQGVPVVRMATPVRDVRGKVIGAIVGVINLGQASFLDTVTKQRYGQSGGYFVADPKARLNIVATDKSRIMQPLPPPGVSPAIDRFVAGYEGTLVYVNQLGVEVLVSVKRIPVADWAMAVNLPTEEAFAPIRATQRRMLLITILFTVLAGGLTGWVAWRMTHQQLKPMLAATRALARLPDANRPVPELPVGDHSEIGELIRGFNRLLGVLAERQTALQASEASYRGVFENANTGIALTDPAGQVTAFNEAFRTMVGFDAQTLMRMNFADLTHPDDLPAEVVFFNEVLAGQRDHYRMTKRYLASDGHVFWIDISVAAIRDAQGKVSNFVGVVHDITERQQVAALRASEAFKQAILDAIPSEVAVLDSNGMILTVNHAWRQFARDNALEPGLPVAGTDVGDNYLAVCSEGADVLPEDARQACAGIRAVLEGRLDSFSHEYPCHSPQHQRWFSMTVTPLGEVAQHGAVVTHTDITARRLHEHLAEERAEYTQAVLDNVIDGIVTIDARGVVLTLNRAAEAIFGYAAAEVVGRNVHMLMPEPDRSLHDGYLKDFRKTGVPKVIGIGREVEACHKDGSIFPMDLAVSRSVHLGQPIFIGVVRDITLQRQAELAMRQARDAAESASKAKSEFLSSMSHELRTPMNAILGFAQLIDYDPSLSDEQKDNAREILKAGYHLLQLINEVLDLSRVESGQMVLSLEPVEVGAIVLECLNLVHTMAQQHGIGLSHGELGDVAVRADRTRLRQVLINLLSNAVKYNRQGGSVRVELARQGEDRLRILVIDTGAGIPEARLHELFQPFNRLGVEGSGIEGSGIGLTITRRLIEMMGGAVDVRSEVGVGSTFWVELQLEPTVNAEPKDPMSQHAMPAQQPDGTLHTVLYIEDNPANLRLVAQILGRRKDIRLLTADTPQAGIALALAQHPALVLLDVNMPGMDGYQVLAVLRADPSLPPIPVVAVTANAMPRDVERGLAAGFADYLTKPLDLTRFHAVLDRLLRVNDHP